VASTICFFVTDLHGKQDRFGKLFAQIRREPPGAVFLGGDLLPHTSHSRLSRGRRPEDFVRDFLAPGFRGLRNELGAGYPSVFLIPGNDDPRVVEEALEDRSVGDLWHSAHNRKLRWESHPVFGYACVPPTPFLLKDWERYDVSRYVEPGCVSPEEGIYSIPVPDREKRYGTIQADLDRLAGDEDLSEAIFLFHTPPYRTKLDRAALDGMHVDRVPVDVHVGSIAVRRFIEKHRPLVTLHGHIHESARLTGCWREEIGRTHAFSAAHDGPELALVRFTPVDPARATRVLL